VVAEVIVRGAQFQAKNHEGDRSAPASLSSAADHGPREIL
jgi:hypothetical protein